MPRATEYDVVWSGRGPLPLPCESLSNETRPSQRTRQQAIADTVLRRAEPHLHRPPKLNYPRPRTAKLSDDRVREIRRVYATGEGGYAALGKRFGVWPATINQIVHRDTYRYVT